MKWVMSKNDCLAILCNSQIYFYNPDKKTCEIPLKDTNTCKDFALFENNNEELCIAILCQKAVLIVQVQPDLTVSRKQLFSLDENPTNFAVCKTGLLLQYPKDLERILFLLESKIKIY